MILVFYLLSSLVVIKTILNLLYYIQLWFIMEYRFDRVLIHLKTEQGKQVVFPPFKKPPITPKTIILFVASLVILLIIYLLLPVGHIWKAVLIYILAFPIVSLQVIFLKIPTYLFHELQIMRAVQKLRKHKKMIVVGITGSFGKTTTKEFLATILSTKYQVLKTPESKNSPIAIAETILLQLQPNHTIFIVEMGAYKTGEISKMVEMVKPEIGILMAINEQHQDLFGSFAKKMQAKFELLAGLSGRKISIINGDNTYTRTMGEWANKNKLKVWWFTKSGLKSKIGEKVFQGTNIRSTHNDISFIVEENNKREKIVVEILGEHQVTNILAAIAGAVAVGMTLKEAVSAAKKIMPFHNTMNPQAGVNGSTFINDTFNNNPDAAIAALEYLKTCTGKKILVFQPMIELGEFAEKSHTEVGEIAGRVCDGIFLTNKNYNDAFLKGVASIDPNKLVLTLTASDLANMLRKRVTTNDTVLFKGKEAGKVLAQLI